MEVKAYQLPLPSVSTSDFSDSYMISNANTLQGDNIFSSSSFAESNLRANNVKNINIIPFQQDNTNLLNTFFNIVDNRLEYLDSLSKLSANWITGTAETPTADVIHKMKLILIGFRNHANMQILRKIPRLVIGPVPSGGIGIEFHVNSDTALYVTLFNDNTVEVEKKVDNFFADIHVDFTCLDTKVLNLYDDISGK